MIERLILNYREWKIELNLVFEVLFFFINFVWTKGDEDNWRYLVTLVKITGLLFITLYQYTSSYIIPWENYTYQKVYA